MSCLISLLLLLLCEHLCVSFVHKPAHELDPSAYAEWQLPPASARWRTQQQAQQAQQAAERKRRATGRDDRDLAEDYSDRPVPRQWSEVLLSAIRRDKARPTVHARNLYHFSVAVWNAWLAYNGAASLQPVLLRDLPRRLDLPADARANATAEAVSFAAFGLLRYRFAREVDAVLVGGFLNATMARLGFSVALADEPVPASRPLEPYQVGNLIAAAIIAHGRSDNSCEADDYDCPVGHPHHYEPVNRFSLNPYWNGVGALEDPNRWQSLEIGQFIDQAGIAIDGYPPYTGPQWGFVTPFALNDTHHRLNVDGAPRANVPPAFDGVFFDPGEPPYWGQKSPTHQQYLDNFTVVVKVSSMLSVDGVIVSVSPRNSAFGSNNHFARNKCDLTPGELCHNVGVGHSVNPATGEPYEANDAQRGDYTRVLAEFWADGPQSETPPGHWFSILNRVFDHPAFEYRWGGAGAEMDRTEYVVRAYLALGATVHDAAVAAWGVKFKYDYVRPITAVRFMASLGQSSNKSAPSWHWGGMPIIEGHTRVLALEDVCVDNCELEQGFTPGPLYRLGRHNVGKVIGRAWDSLSFYCAGVCWMPLETWKTYQRPSFVTPPFAAYVSGHSTFSRAAADMLTIFTGSAYFPGGIARFVAPGGFEAEANDTDFLVFENGPSQTVEIQWATYSDASDECSLSRIYGSIHPPSDDLPGRRIGRQVAQVVWAKLVNEVFGPVKGTRAAVRLRFKGDGLPPRFEGSENATMAWARAVALDAHERAQASDAAAAKLEGVTARVLPRQPAEQRNERTVMLFGAHANAGANMMRLFGSDPDVEQVVELECTPLLCEERSEGDGPLGIVVLIVVAAIVLVVVGALTTICTIRKKRAKAVVKA